MKRQRGRNRRNNNNNNNANRSMDSNGPDVKVRGTASQIHDKYVALARDAAASGNRIKAENLRQHAEHYLRMTNAMEAAKQAAREEREEAEAANASSEDEGEGEKSEGSRRSRRYPPRVGRDKDRNSSEKSAEENPAGLEVVTPEAEDAKASEGEEAPAKSTRRRKAPARKSSEETIEAAE